MKNKTILIIDDEPAIRLLLENLIISRYPEVSVLKAASRKETLSLLSSIDSLDAAFLDLGLPDGDGVSLIAEIKKVLPVSSIFVVSGNYEHSKIKSTLSAGALGYLKKPFNKANFIKILESKIFQENN